MSVLDWNGAEERRALSADMPHVEWPPAVGLRIHYNSGWGHTSWTAEVRGVIDDEVAVIFKTVPCAGRSDWALLSRIQVQMWRDALRIGPMPKALTQIEAV